MAGGVEKHQDTLPPEPVAATGGPGSKPRWTSGAKTAVGVALAPSSRLWFTIGQGILNELYFPDIDKANTRTVRFLITDDLDFFSEEEHDATHEVTSSAPGIPDYTIVSTCRQGRYRITKEIITQSSRDTLLMRVTFEPTDPSAGLHLFLGIEPHLGDLGSGNTAWVGAYHGLPMLFAGRASSALAAFCSVPFLKATAGYVGVNDGYIDLKKNRTLTSDSNIARDGNVGLCAEIDYTASNGKFVVALAFGSEPAEAGQQARAGILSDFDDSRERFRGGWKGAHEALRPMKAPEGSAHDLYRISAAVLKTHESKRFPGGFVASLSLPWGFARGDEDSGAYHVLWPRDLCETAMGLMAAGDADSGRRALFYLACTQKQDGSWSQNMWLDGTEHWGAIQMDGIAMPILLADQLRREDLLQGYDAWPMIRAAARFLVRMGPGSQQDRWEALSGYAIFTMACEIAGLLAAADFADDAGESSEAEFLRSTADAWNDAVDSYTYAAHTELAKQHNVDGYYIRIAPSNAIQPTPPDQLWLHLQNHAFAGGHHRAVDVLSPDALALVRFGLRSADDPRMRDTITMLDAKLRKELTTGPGWIRSTDDGYGEHADGSPYNGHGIGRCWPLLVGERGHYEIALGNRDAATELLRVLSRQTSPCGMLPEQVWDAEDIPAHQLFNGHPAGSGMPLAWAHAEYIKLVRSLEDGAVWDCPPQTVERYQVQKVVSPFEIWTEEAPREWVSSGKNLRMDFNSGAHVTWHVGTEDPISLFSRAPILGLHSVLILLPAVWETLHLTITTSGQTKDLRLRHRSVSAQG